ncbi:12977_t:CDS:2 [Funneliformis geosporum]|nr:12977_t:CDS:2 [Funneliformis geosporum]
MLENTDTECSCPYAFEGKNTDLVARSPPEVNDFKSLDVAWKKRFTTTAKILNMEESMWF